MPHTTRRTLRAQLLIGSAVVAAAPLLTLGVVAGARLVHTAEREAVRELTVQADAVVERLDDYVARHQRGLAALTEAVPHDGALAAHYAAQLPSLGRMLDGFLSMIVADSNGTIVAAYARDSAGSSTSAIGQSVADREYFRAPMRSGAPYLSPAFVGRGVGRDRIIAITAPVPGDDGRPVGVLAGALSLDRFMQFSHGVRALDSAQLVVVDTAQRVMYAFNAPAITFLDPMPRRTGDVFIGSQSRTTAASGGGRPDADQLEAVAISALTGWQVMVSQPRSVSRAVWPQHLLTIVVGIAVAVALCLLLALQLAARVTRPIERLSVRLRSFDADNPPPIEATMCEKAPAEIDALLRDFAGMAARIHESSSAQRASESRFRAIFDHAAIGIALHDDDGRFLESNAAFQEIVGYSGEELRQLRASDLSAPDEANVTRGPVKALKAGAVDRVSVEKHLIHRDGREILCELTVSRLDAQRLPGAQGGMVGMVQDVTARRTLEREMVWRANHDSLTGLANRARLQERLAVLLAGRRVARSIAVLTLDLDEFKRVNDSLGHAEGDQLLREVSQRLLSATRGCDVVARLGGDEFAVVLDGLGTPVYAHIVAERILDALERPIALQGAEVVVSTSIGIAYAQPADSVDELLRNADTAMYRAKHGGKATYDTYTLAMHAEVADMLALENDLRGALNANEFYPVYQLIVDLRTGEPRGAECLLRWRRNGEHLVSPARFVPIAEQTGLIIPIGRWVLQAACREGAAWLARVPAASTQAPPFTITVNISGRQLHDPNIVSDVREALRESGFDARCLVLEITESVVMRNADTAIRRLSELKALGVRLAIDDFGTGYSSLSYLQRLPIDVLKIDKSFIDGVLDPQRGAPLVRTIIGLTETLSLRCVAEGIETVEQLEALQALNCAFGQGYLFARPMSGAEAANRLFQPHGNCALPSAADVDGLLMPQG